MRGSWTRRRAGRRRRKLESGTRLGNSRVPRMRGRGDGSRCCAAIGEEMGEGERRKKKKDIGDGQSLNRKTSPQQSYLQLWHLACVLGGFLSSGDLNGSIYGVVLYSFFFALDVGYTHFPGVYTYTTRHDTIRRAPSTNDDILQYRQQRVKNSSCIHCSVQIGLLFSIAGDRSNMADDVCRPLFFRSFSLFP